MRPDEHYSPPPKIRRTIGQRRRRASPNRDDISLHPGHDPDTELFTQRSTQFSTSAENSTLAERTSLNQEYHQIAHVPDDTFDIFANLPFDFDEYSAFGPMDLDAAGESLDFIPVPTIDPGLLHLGQMAKLVAERPNAASKESQQLDVNVTLDVTGSADDGFAANNAHSLSMKEGDRRLIQHYLSVMKGYAKVEDRPRDTNNLFVSAFSMSLFFMPLYYAILSFSASHLAMEDPSYLDAATEYEKLAENAYNSHQGNEPVEIDGLLSALFVRVKRVHVTGERMEKFLDLVSRAIELISRPEVEEAMKNPDGLVRRVVIRLAILDARASHYRLGGGALIKRLRQLPCLSSVFDREARQTPSILGISSLLRADTFRMRVADLDVRLHKQFQDEFATADLVRTEEIKALYKDIKREISEWDGQMGENNIDNPATTESYNVLDPTSYGHLAASLALHSSLLYLHRVYPLPLCDTEKSVSAILYGQLRIHHDPTRASSPSSILPSALFLAGICSNDPIRRDWVVERFKGAEKWGSYVRKARELMQAITDRQASGGVTDVQIVMSETTGEFII
ncbi:hypothetical protein LTR84_011867 [Exophiala bonariae]|uniref:Uncharacterized protein n=1 Tax=Exophiala bonariae TaxID=1690606 RepID=A0AAV9NHL7_9EURO|nr:hypothetical protein LTR84_011867 [Exophiala bonariae]